MVDGDRRMTPVFKPDGTWVTPKRSGTYRMTQTGDVEITVTGRVFVIADDGQISGGGATDKGCAGRVRAIQQ